MRGGLACAVLLAVMATTARAEAPAASIRPQPNPALTSVQPTPESAPTPTAEAVATPTGPVLAPASSLRPVPRPSAELASAAPEPETKAPESNSKKKPKASKKGSVCGDPDIKGETLAAIKGKVKGCGLDKPVRVTAISGIRLNQPATISCETAAATKRWIERALIPAMGKRQLVELRIAASYICRPRNNKKGAKISEHGRGKAIDVSGFVFSDGTEWSIARDYNKQIRRAHKDACGIFGTTLGPGSDGYHEDHLHFDVADYRNGPYCR